MIIFYYKGNKEDFYLVITQLYMVISNIKIDTTNKIIEVAPYYGYLYDLRYDLLKSLTKQLPKYQLTFFFNYLDTYFESKIIYQLGTYSQGENLAKSCGYRINLKEQDYDIIHLLRQETHKQDMEYLPKIQLKFSERLKYLKMEQVNKELPKLFYLKKISHCSQKSRNVIIAVSGFTSQDEDKQIKWKELADLYPNSEIFAVEYQSQTISSVYDQIKSTALTSMIIPGGKLFKAMQFLVKSVYDNPFTTAFTQADLTGTYLAHFLFQGNLFPNCSVSLVGFSLGTQVIAKCLQEYNKLINCTKQPSIIASVVFMGGVVDSNYIKRTQLLDAVTHRVFNCYTTKDKILRYMLRLTQLYSMPIGLQDLHYSKQSGKTKIVNLDFSHQIDGHLPFMSNVTNVLYCTDFRSELLTKCEDKIVSFH